MDSLKTSFPVKDICGNLCYDTLIDKKERLDMKKVFSLLLCLSLLLSLTACGISLPELPEKEEPASQSGASKGTASKKHKTAEAASENCVLVPDTAYYHWTESGETLEAMNFTWEDLVITQDGGYSLRGVCTDYNGDTYMMRYLYHADGTVYMSEMVYPKGETVNTYTGDMLNIDDFCASSLKFAKRKDNTVYLKDTTRMEFEIDEDGRMTGYTHYQPTGKKIRIASFNSSGFPVETHDFDKHGEESGWYEYTYRDMPIPEK